MSRWLAVALLGLGGAVLDSRAQEECEANASARFPPFDSWAQHCARLEWDACANVTETHDSEAFWSNVHSRAARGAAGKGRAAAAVPVVVRKYVAGMPALAKWRSADYVLEALKRDIAQHQAAVMAVVTQKPFFHGKDVLQGRLDYARVERDPGRAAAWLTSASRMAENASVPGEGGSGPESSGESAYIGLLPLSRMPALAGDLDPVPEGLREHAGVRSPSQFDLWLGDCERYIDTGLHVDDHKGGYLMQVVGRKEVLLFPPQDKAGLYLRPATRDSRAFLTQIASGAEFRQRYPDFLARSTSPRIAALQPGDMLYIPGGWYHDAVSIGRTASISAWPSVGEDDAMRR